MDWSPSLLCLGEPQCVAVRIIDVEFARAPALVDGAFMNRLRSVRIPGCVQPSLPELAKQCVDVVGRDDDRLTEGPVPAMAGEDELVSVAQDSLLTERLQVTRMHLTFHSK